VPITLRVTSVSQSVSAVARRPSGGMLCIEEQAGAHRVDGCCRGQNEKHTEPSCCVRARRRLVSQLWYDRSQKSSSCDTCSAPYTYSYRDRKM
jgi:hypothetical protein